jgi:hypothetical protein
VSWQILFSRISVLEGFGGSDKALHRGRSSTVHTVQYSNYNSVHTVWRDLVTANIMVCTGLRLLLERRRGKRREAGLRRWGRESIRKRMTTGELHFQVVTCLTMNVRYFLCTSTLGIQQFGKVSATADALPEAQSETDTEYGGWGQKSLDCQDMWVRSWYSAHSTHVYPKTRPLQ